MRVLIVDHHVLFRQGLVALLAKEPDITVVGEAGSGKEAIEKVAELEPELVLMDIGLPDKDGLEVLRTILSIHTNANIVILTLQEDDDLLFTALRYGAKGYLLKETSFSILVASLKALDRGEVALSRTMTTRVIEEFTRLSAVQDHGEGRIQALTSREIEVIRQLAVEATNREISERLSISESTVKIHIHNILRKLQLRKRSQLAGFARRYEL